MVNNGQSKQISANQTRNYMRDVLMRADGGWPGYEPQMGTFDEGFKLEFSPLLSVDGTVVDAVLRCEIDHLEKLIPVMVDVPTVVAPRQRQKIEVPQGVSARLHERFRWPTEQVLLVSMGVVPSPVPVPPGGFSVPLLSNPDRADMLIFVESRGNLERNRRPCNRVNARRACIRTATKMFASSQSTGPQSLPNRQLRSPRAGRAIH